MLIAQITDTHIKAPGRLAYGKVDTAAMLRDCVAELMQLDPQPDLIVHTGDLVDLGSDEEYAHLRQILRPLRQDIIYVPGNHDDREAMRRAFPEHLNVPARGPIQFAIMRGTLRIIGLDTLIPGEGGGELCRDRLSWLETTLAADRQVPTLILMHHPAFETGIAHMDRIGLKGRDSFAHILSRNAQIVAVLAGHVHRSIHALVGNRRALVCPSTAHQVALDLRPDGPSAFRQEPAGYMLHRFIDGTLVTHTALVGAWPDPYPFFDENGHLID